MKKLLFVIFATFFANFLHAQDDKSKMPSPPATLVAKIGGTNVTINYSQPAVKGRKVWDASGQLAPYGKVWRTGANNATTFEIDADALIEGKKLEKGKYALFTIPGEKEWVIIFNKKSAQWGAYSYKADEDVLRVTVPAQKANSFIERFTISLENNNSIALGWENVKAVFKVI
jgi:Protein of unknown function (DUF2911)